MLQCSTLEFKYKPGAQRQVADHCLEPHLTHNFQDDKQLSSFPFELETLFIKVAPERIFQLLKYTAQNLILEAFQGG